MAFSGSSSYWQRANHKLKTDGADDADDHLRAVVSGVPSVSVSPIISSVPFALVGGIWSLWWMGFIFPLWRWYRFYCPCRVAAEFGGWRC
ncbi:hypothetical protein ACNKHN_02650 [Shigella flexneri]